MVIQEAYQHISKEIKKVIVGQDEVVRQLLTAFFSGGHVILEGVPGLAKTILARTFARIIGKLFNRIQFTPDLMPSDIIGTNVYHLESSTFIVKKGPVFTNILLADEINRASPKTQSALLEIMQEKQVTLEGVRYEVPLPFMVLATQNPIEFEGTYPLPEAQLDRFFLKIIVRYPDAVSELTVLRNVHAGFNSDEIENIRFETISDNLLKECRKEFSEIKVEEPILQYILAIIQETRRHKAVILGASTRAAIHLLTVSKYSAAFEGRGYVIPDDVKAFIHPVLRHRLILEAETEIEGIQTDDIIKEIIEKVEVPR